MRLICGIWHLDGKHVDLAMLDSMAAGMIAAGLTPEVRRSVEGNVGFAVVDFAATASAPPAPVSHSGIMLAADRRLDTPGQLAASLDCPGADQDILIGKAVERWGSDAPRHLSGDFSFAHWDPEARRLLCARDMFGVRPFYYAWRPGECFAFASFPSGLHGGGLVQRTFDRVALARHLVQQQRPGEALFTGMARLPAAHCLEVSADGLAVRRYWAPDARIARRRHVTPDEAAIGLRTLLDAAVRSRLPESGNVAAHLSGGLDSSAIAILAARQLHESGRQLHAWSFLDVQRNDVVLDDETAFVQAVLEQESGIAWTAVRPPRDDIDPGAFHSDLPLPVGPEDPDCAVCAGAAAAGAHIVLSGWGGDEAATFNGRGALAELLLKGRWRTLARECSALRRERGVSIADILRGEVIGYLLPTFWHAARSRKRGDGLRHRLLQCLPNDIAAALGKDRDGALSMGPDAGANRTRLIGSSHIAQRCENWAAQGAQHGVAFAFPMLDRRVVEYALSLPSELFLRDGWKRRVFRDAMKGVLPDMIRERHAKATPFPALPLIMAEQKEKLAARVDEVAANDTVRTVLDVDALRAQVAALPDPATIKATLSGNPAPSADAAALRQILRLAVYIAQDR